MHHNLTKNIIFVLFSMTGTAALCAAGESEAKLLYAVMFARKVNTTFKCQLH